MKILNINSNYYRSSVHRQLQKALLAKGLDSISYVPVELGYVPRDECRYGEDDHVVKTECYHRLDRYIFHLKQGKALRALPYNLDIRDFTCLHAHSLFSNGYIALKLKEKFGLPYVVAVRDTDLNLYFRYMIFLRPLGLRILKGANRIVFLSKPYRNFTLQKYVPTRLRNVISTKSVVIPSGINNFWFKNLGSAKKKLDGSLLRLVYVGSIMKRKNLITTTRAIEILEGRGYRVSFTVVGRIVNQSVFRRIKGLPYVNYISPKPKEELLKIYRRNDIFVMPSITETFGLVYPEALSQGLPVIYSKGQGFDGQFDEGVVGYHVDCFDEKEIADRILDIVADYARFSHNCIQGVDRFCWDGLAMEYMKIYNAIGGEV